VKRFLAVILTVGALSASACTSSTITIDVFAASSLTDAFAEIEERFEAANPEIDIRLNLAGSDTLRRQIADGARADVFAPASLALFAGLDVTPIPYAANQLEIVVTADSGLTDRVIAGDLGGLLIARCAAGVPCGTAADRLVADLGLDLSGTTVTAEASVRAVLSKVQLGEADVGFVYRTDTVAAAGEVVPVGLTSDNARVVLALAALVDDESDASEAAEAFVAFAVSQDDVFAALGFERAP
jgi:molybdate transport system substrate-binding protein